MRHPSPPQLHPMLPRELQQYALAMSNGQGVAPYQPADVSLFMERYRHLMTNNQDQQNEIKQNIALWNAYNNNFHPAVPQISQRPSTSSPEDK